MKTRKLTFHTDPGHGWLEVSRSDLAELGIAASVTPYSYQDAGRVYLEEDCDASLYLEAAKAAGWRVTMVEKYADPSPVRNFQQYRQTTITPLFQALDQLGKLSVVHIK